MSRLTARLPPAPPLETEYELIGGIAGVCWACAEETTAHCGSRAVWAEKAYVGFVLTKGDVKCASSSPPSRHSCFRSRYFRSRTEAEEQRRRLANPAQMSQSCRLSGRLRIRASLAFPSCRSPIRSSPRF